MTLDAADDLEAAVRSVTGRGAFLVVNSHWHDDHTGGNQLLGQIPIVSTRRTVELMVEYCSTDPAEYAADIEEYLDYARQQEAAAETDEDRRRAAGSRRAAELLFTDRERFRLTLPNTFIDDRMVISGSHREIEILTYGGGHTESDVFVNIPAEHVLVGGDLIWVGRHPRTRDGDPAEWAESLERMVGLSPARLIPGHGPVADGGFLDTLREYLWEVDRLISDASIADDQIDGLPVPAGSEDWLGPHNFTEGVAALR